MIKIREFTIEDYITVINLWIESKLPFKPNGRDEFKNIKKEIKRENAIFLVAEHKGKIVGSVFGTHDGRKGWINRLAVSPKYQRKGLGKELCLNLEKIFYNLNIKIIACLIEDWNENSSIFFRKIGYIKHEDILYFSKRRKKST
jgi:ribosomal protein S18 acetylase RimI-like enzyme